MYSHKPVLLGEVIKYLNPKADQDFIDATVGVGGHTRRILEGIKPKGRLLGLDRDNLSLYRAKSNLKKYQGRLDLVWGNFANLAGIAREHQFDKINGIVFDLGISSAQLENPDYGLSFRQNSHLDMRLDSSQFLKAADILNKYPWKKLADVFYKYGDIGNSRALARKIVASRQRSAIRTTAHLVEAIGTKNPKMLAPIFQALRIEVNQELDNLQSALGQSIDILKNGGRIVVISYHSGEDRIVKHFFLRHKDELEILTKKPVTASRLEIKDNPRARSAKLRVAIKTRS